jgi:hypothetical protein
MAWEQEAGGVVARSVMVIDREALRDIRTKVFREQTSTMRDEAARFSLPDFEATLTDLRRGIRSLLLALPDSAFVPDSTDTDVEVWKAGQVIGHVYDAQTNTFLRPVRLIAGMPQGPTAYSPGPTMSYPLLSREGALATLDNADRDLLEVLGLLSPEVDLCRTYEDERVGKVSIRALLLFLAIHDDDHLGQLEGLLPG